MLPFLGRSSQPGLMGFDALEIPCCSILLSNNSEACFLSVSWSSSLGLGSSCPWGLPAAQTLLTGESPFLVHLPMPRHTVSPTQASVPGEERQSYLLTLKKEEPWQPQEKQEEETWLFPSGNENGRRVSAQGAALRDSARGRSAKGLMDNKL